MSGKDRHSCNTKRINKLNSENVRSKDKWSSPQLNVVARQSAWPSDPVWCLLSLKLQQLSTSRSHAPKRAWPNEQQLCTFGWLWDYADYAHVKKKQFGWLWDDLNEEVINKTAQNPQLTAEVWLKQWSLAQQIEGPGDSTTWTGTSGWGNPARKRFICSIKRRFKLDLLQTRFFQRLSRTECIRVCTGLESTRLPGISEMHCSLHLFAVWFPALMAGLPSWHLRKEGWMRFRCVQLSLWWKKCVTLNLHMKFKELFRWAFSPKTQSPLTTHLKGAQVETGWRWSLITNGSQERKWKLISPFSSEQWSQRPQNWRLILLAVESQRSCCLSQG